MSWVYAVTYILTFTKKGTVAYITKNRFLLKIGVFYWASKSTISVEKGVFFSSNIREKEVFFKLGYERGIRVGRGGGAGSSLRY